MELCLFLAGKLQLLVAIVFLRNQKCLQCLFESVQIVCEMGERRGVIMT